MRHRGFIITVSVAAAFLISAALYYQHVISTAAISSSARPYVPDKDLQVQSAQNIRVSPSAGTGDVLSYHRLSELALLGDSKAQRHLSELYESCVSYLINSRVFSETARTIMAHSEINSEAALEKTIGRIEASCQPLEGEVSYAEADASSKLWLAESAAGDDLVSILRMAVRGSIELNHEEKQNLIEASIKSGDPDVLFEMSPLLRHESGNLGVPQEYTGPVAENAWAIVACRLGAQACLSSSPLLTNICLQLGRCIYGSYEEFIYTEILSTADQRRVEKLIPEVSRIVID